jgi:hypothetical protein
MCKRVRTCRGGLHGSGACVKFGGAHFSSDEGALLLVLDTMIMARVMFGQFLAIMSMRNVIVITGYCVEVEGLSVGQEVFLEQGPDGGQGIEIFELTEAVLVVPEPAELSHGPKNPARLE